MQIIKTFEKHDPTTNGFSITIKQTYIGSEEEIKKIEDYCNSSIGTMTCEQAKPYSQNHKGGAYG